MGKVHFGAFLDKGFHKGEGPLWGLPGQGIHLGKVHLGAFLDKCFHEGEGPIGGLPG